MARLKWVLLDPGHGGRREEGGSTGSTVGEVTEAPLNLAVAFKLQRLVHSWGGAPCGMTREGDISVNFYQRRLAERRLVEIWGEPGVVLSLHCDSVHADPLQKGMRTYHYPGNIISSMVGAHILKACPQPMQWSDHVWESIDASADYPDVRYVIGAYRADCILVEMGFITNEDDREHLQNERMQWRIAAACLCGILAWMSNEDI